MPEKNTFVSIEPLSVAYQMPSNCFIDVFDRKLMFLTTIARKGRSLPRLVVVSSRELSAKLYGCLARDLAKGDAKGACVAVAQGETNASN